MEKTFWDGRSEELNTIWEAPEEVPEYRQVMQALITQELKDNPELDLVDCGSGTGLVYRYLPEELKPRYRGFDFTRDMVNYCKEKYPEAQDRFKQVDLTKPRLQSIRGDLLITQNVIQHILLWQYALDNIFKNARHGVILCERTHRGQTLLAGYEPAYRWRFNIRDFFDVLEYLKNKYNYKGEVEILGHPLTTNEEPNCLTIYRVYRTKESERHTIDLGDFIYEPLAIHPKRPYRTKTQRIKRFIAKAIYDVFWGNR
jgi:SAM-dependent methyltransferase